MHVKGLARGAPREEVQSVVAIAAMVMVVLTLSLAVLRPRAIQESLLTSTEGLYPETLNDSSRFDSDLQLAMELSAKELAERELRLQEEEAELQQVLQLSLTDK